MSASVKPIDKITMNKNKTYFGALDVIAKILLGSKYLNIYKLYIKKDNLVLLWKVILIKNVEGVIKNGKRYFTFLIKIWLKFINYICPIFEQIVLKKRIN